jgi:hypothetical protein
MVGVLESSDKNEFASFDKRGRVDAKILKFFIEIGIAQDHILYIKDKEATTYEVKKAFANFLKKGQKRLLVIFFTAEKDITMTKKGLLCKPVRRRVNSQNSHVYIT